MAININFLANVRDVLRGGDDVEEKFEDVASSLDDLAKAGKQAGDKLGDGVGDGAKQAERYVEKLERGFKEMADAGRKESKSVGDDIDRNVKRGTDGAEDGLKDFKDESASTAKESAASFDGSAESIVDAFQEVAANAFVGFGPAGMIAGLAAAAGIGLISAAMETGGEDADELKQKISDMTSEIIDSKSGSVSIEYLSGKLRELATEAEGVNLKELSKTAKQSGLDFRDLAQAYAGNRDGLKELWREADRAITSLKAEKDATSQGTAAGKDRALALAMQIKAQQDYHGYVGQAIDIAKQAAEADRNYALAGGPEMERKAALIDSIQGSIDDAASSWEDYRNKETGALDPAGFLAGIQARTDAANGYAANLAAVQAQLSPEAYQYLVDQGIDFAPMLQSIIDSGLVGELNNQFTQAVDAGNTALSGIDKNIDVTVTTTADTKPATADLFRVRDDKSIITTVGTKADTKPATDQIKQAAAQQQTSTIVVDADLSNAETKVNNFVNRTRTINVTVKAVTPDGKPIY